MEASPPTGRPRLDARMTAWLIEQRSRMRTLELGQARMEGELAASERIERAAQRYADKLEEKLAEARRREASLARALGYAEAQRDQLQARLEGRPARALPGAELPGAELPEIEELELTPVPPRGAPTPGAARR